MQYSENELESYLRSGAHETQLRREFGDLLYEDLSRLARQIDDTPEVLERARRKVFILPGIMGSRLSLIRGGVQDLVWIDPFDIIGGGLRKLWPVASDAVIAATGTVFAPYFRMRLRLKLAGYDAEFLPYDWRLSPQDTGAALLAHIKAKGHSNVALVCHSMGGLVARALAAGDPDAATISRVITIGTPNHGSYAPVEIMALSHGSLRTVAGFDLSNDTREIASDVLRHLPGLLQMLPSPRARSAENYFSTAAWPGSTVKPLKTALTSAHDRQKDLALPDARFTQIVGWSEDTVVQARKKGNELVFEMRRDGDGTVPRDLAETDGTKRYYTRGRHGSLCNRSDVIAATIDLIASDQTARLPKGFPAPGLESQRATSLTAKELAERLDRHEKITPERETDFAGGFLEAGPWDDDEQPHAARATAPQSTRRVNSYPIDIVTQAHARWESSRAEREDVKDKINSAMPLHTENAPRLKAYTERLLLQVKAQPRPDPKILADLETAVRKIENVDLQSPTLPAAEKIFFERVIGVAEEFLSVMFVKRAVAAASSVGRIVTRDTHEGFGTGFLIAPGVLMTNQHVLQNALQAQEASVQFRFELEIDSREMSGHVFTLAPERLFHANEGLDMAVVAVAPFALDGTALAEFGQLPLIGAEGKIRKGQPVNIVQHPLGGRKQVVFRESTLSALPEDNDHVAHYTGDTQPGSSGSPVFSDRWEVVALHHSGVPDTDGEGRILDTDGRVWDRNIDPNGKTINWIANEGIRISRIMRHLSTLPARFEADGKPGADLIRSILSISQEASVSGAFIFAPETVCSTCEARKVASALPEPAAEHATPEPRSVITAGNSVLPLELSIELTVPRHHRRVT